MRMISNKSSADRKLYPITEGLLDYFPDACAEVAYVSFVGNEKHNPGEALHHARGKSMDHANCIARHLLDRGEVEEITLRGKVYKIRHSAALAWRALALLQEELEREHGLGLPRAAKEDGPCESSSAVEETSTTEIFYSPLSPPCINVGPSLPCFMAGQEEQTP
jgi:hypothetical protein